MQEQAIAWRHAGDDIGLVPTMGALHAGHDSLVGRARHDNQRVVVSIFVNPMQFGPHEDFKKYPRPFEQDRARMEALGVDAIFHPPVDQIYPAAFKTRVDPGPLGEVLEGKSRPGHFGGVLTVVLKLLNLTQPKRAYFGQKDAQQGAVLQRLVRDLDLTVEIRMLPTVRDTDGLAWSSRNVLLSAGERAEALALPRALHAGADAFSRGEDPVLAARAQLNGLTPDYVEIVNLEGASVLAAAVRVGSTRLIDNVLLEGDLT